MSTSLGRGVLSLALLPYRGGAGQVRIPRHPLRSGSVRMQSLLIRHTFDLGPPSLGYRPCWIERIRGRAWTTTRIDHQPQAFYVRNDDLSWPTGSELSVSSRSNFSLEVRNRGGEAHVT